VPGRVEIEVVEDKTKEKKDEERNELQYGPRFRIKMRSDPVHEPNSIFFF